MNLYCIKCANLTSNNNDIKIDRKINLYSHCIDCSFKGLRLSDSFSIQKWQRHIQNPVKHLKRSVLRK